MRAQTFVERLPCKLTAEEKALKNEQRTQLTQDAMDVEEKAKEAADGFKTTLKTVEKALLDLHRELRTGEEVRPIECIEVFRFDQDMVEIVRNDTGEVVRKRAMDPRDRQSHLSLGNIDSARDTRSKRERKGQLRAVDEPHKSEDDGDQGPETH